MAVEWRFAADADGVTVELVHDLVMRWPLIGRLVGDLLVGPIFINYTARKTLQAVKIHAEAVGTHAQKDEEPRLPRSATARPGCLPESAKAGPADAASSASMHHSSRAASPQKSQISIPRNTLTQSKRDG
jgi:hypothetical protein